VFGGFRAAVTLIFLLAPFAFGKRAAIDQGQYILYADGCLRCHTSENGPDLTGGVPFELPSGLLYPMNVTTNVETGIKGQLREELSTAMRKGTSPDGSHLLYRIRQLRIYFFPQA